MAYTPEQGRTSLGRFQHKLTKKLGDSIVASVSDGLFDLHNAMQHGVDITTLRSWIERGLDEEAEDPYKEFAERYMKASIALEKRAVKAILDAAEPLVETPPEPSEDGFEWPKVYKRQVDRGDWRAAAWYLERRWPLRWSANRVPEGGPKEAIRLPEATFNRRKRVENMGANPPPELLEMLRRSGWNVTREEEPEKVA